MTDRTRERLRDLVAEVRDFHAGRGDTTHWATCYTHHSECLAARVLELLTEEETR
jgi:hypothetical protein